MADRGPAVAQGLFQSLQAAATLGTFQPAEGDLQGSIRALK
jgi:hypothetical protein